VAPDIEVFVVAGGFGEHLEEWAALRTGLLPPEAAGHTVFVGNSSLAGAALMLTETDAPKRARSLAGSLRIVELADDPRFQERFLASLGFPGLS
jgi:uncharacterized 2Fe-2S/4Fe-4S cluster protein (DUF4445 family)